MIGLVKVNDGNYIVACGLFFVCFGCFEYMEITSKQIPSPALLVVITLQQLLPAPLHFAYSLSRPQATAAIPTITSFITWFRSPGKVEEEPFLNPGLREKAMFS